MLMDLINAIYFNTLTFLKVLNPNSMIFLPNFVGWISSVLIQLVARKIEKQGHRLAVLWGISVCGQLVTWVSAIKTATYPLELINSIYHELFQPVRDTMEKDFNGLSEVMTG